VLPFDVAASKAYAALMARARRAGRSIGASDGYIAATAAANNMMVATRDTAPFAAAAVPVINPWEPDR
jgi:predicted nucleic acid-binding protein